MRLRRRSLSLHCRLRHRGAASRPGRPCRNPGAPPAGSAAASIRADRVTRPRGTPSAIRVLATASAVGARVAIAAGVTPVCATSKATSGLRRRAAVTSGRSCCAATWRGDGRRSQRVPLARQRPTVPSTVRDTRAASAGSLLLPCGDGLGSVRPAAFPSRFGSPHRTTPVLTVLRLLRRWAGRHRLVSACGPCACWYATRPGMLYRFPLESGYRVVLTRLAR